MKGVLLLKKWILSLSGGLVIGIIISTIMYENQTHVAVPQSNLPKVEQENAQQNQTNGLRPVTYEQISYSLQNEELNITYNKGEDWVRVPIEKDSLFVGEYNGSKDELIPGSYIFSDARVGFIYGTDSILFKFSRDHGVTWQEGVISKNFPYVRYRKVDFLNDQFGYAVLTGDRTMSQEFSAVFLTHDGGITWDETTTPPSTRIIADGGFIDENTGFMSYGTINPDKPDLYVTQDGGQTWHASVIEIPEQYDLIFVQAELPIREEDHLSLLINQGSNGDYAGGKVKGKFISKDNGLTWSFAMEVQPNEAE
ncbi:oxidoreductase [Robertmurraya yapensis]|uniref:Oxidoreductase n=1 Tax=Bacillus yapensis TaxID=2492960 RepID=A0A431WFC9_9BACI|nr:oxidoreductase [Bacillus yapensis]TKS97339.1 oxidoreductase [Bacillus yapensis]